MDERDLFTGLSQRKNEELKIEFLERVIKLPLPELNNDVRKTACHHLADLYKQKKWYSNAAKYYNEVADLSKTFDEKANFLYQTAEMFVKSNDYFTAEDYFRKVLVLAKPSEKEAMKEKILEVYLKHARNYEESRKTSMAIQAYNKILTFKLPLENANKIRAKLAELYEKIGNVREANHIRGLSNTATKMAAEEQARKTAEEEKKKAEEKLKGFYTLDEFN